MVDISIYAPYIALAIALIAIYNIRKKNSERPEPSDKPKTGGGGGGKK